MPTVQFYLAFANLPSSPLPALKGEADALRKTVEAAVARRLCAVLQARHLREFASVGDLFTMFLDRPPDEVGVLHFAGHGSPTELIFTETAGGPAPTDPGPLGNFLGRQNLKLVFLNACSTRAHSQRLLDAGVPAVVVTSRVLRDAVAADFAKTFYASLCSGKDIETSFQDAGDLVLATHRASPQGLFDPGREVGARPGPVSPPAELPWELITGRPEDRHWNLASASGNWGALLPPSGDPPPTPFVGLRPYGSTDAAVFFGRGKDVWELYRLATTRPFERVVLVYGRSGVGKSSVLEAGLAPALEKADRAPVPFCPAEVRVARMGGASSPLEELRKKLNAKSDTPLEKAWCDAEKSGKAVYVVLDQFEEVFRRAGEGESEEWLEFVAALGSLYGECQPRGKLLLGFREEHYRRLTKDLEAARLNFAEKPIEALGTDGVEEAVEGVTRVADLQAVEKAPVLHNLPVLCVRTKHLGP